MVTGAVESIANASRRYESRNSSSSRIVGGQVRILVRNHVEGLSDRLQQTLKSGEAYRDPVYYALRALADDLCLMRCMVADGAGLTPTDLDKMSVDLLFNACSEIAMVARRHHGDKRLKAMVLEELAPFFPTPKGKDADEHAQR